MELSSLIGNGIPILFAIMVFVTIIATAYRASKPMDEEKMNSTVDTSYIEEDIFKP